MKYSAHHFWQGGADQLLLWRNKEERDREDPLSLGSQDAQELSHPCAENSCSKSLHLIMIDSSFKNKSVQPGMHANTFSPVFPHPTFLKAADELHPC